VEGNDAGVADQVLDIGLFEPAFGFAGFQLEFGDRLDGVAGDQEFGIGGVELVGGVFGAGEGAVGFAVETGTNGGDGAGEQGVVRGVGGREG
jgi:hypothetical protein